MSVLEQLPQTNEVESAWSEQHGITWYTRAEAGVREVASAMSAVGARFVTITAYELPKQEGFRLEYHWDLAGHLLGFSFALAGNAIESIYDLCEAADWIEREVHEEFGIDFAGRQYEPLLLRPGNAAGVNLREGAPAVKREEVAP